MRNHLFVFQIACDDKRIFSFLYDKNARRIECADAMLCAIVKNKKNADECDTDTECKNFAER